MTQPSEPPRSSSRSVSGWMFVLVGFGILAVWLGVLLLIAALGLPLGNGRRWGLGLLVFTPLIALVIVGIGVVSLIRRKPLTFTPSSRTSGRYGSLGPMIRAQERAEREQRRRLKAERKRDVP